MEDGSDLISKERGETLLDVTGTTCFLNTCITMQATEIKYTINK